jgi:hypothetical protein
MKLKTDQMIDVTNKSMLVHGHGDRGRAAGGPSRGGQQNAWPVPGGVDCGQGFHEDSPAVARHRPGAFLPGATTGKIRVAESLFTPCTPAGSLLEAVDEAAKCASAGDAVLLSPACSSFDQFRNYQQRGEKFCTAVKSISGGMPDGSPNRVGRMALVASLPGVRSVESRTGNEFAPGFFEGKPRCKKTEQLLNERTLNRAIRK